MTSRRSGICSECTRGRAAHCCCGSWCSPEAANQVIDSTRSRPLVDTSNFYLDTFTCIGVPHATTTGNRGQAFNPDFVQGEHARENILLFGRAALDERGAKITGACNAGVGTLENVSIVSLQHPPRYVGHSRSLSLPPHFAVPLFDSLASVRAAFCFHPFCCRWYRPIYTVFSFLSCLPFQDLLLRDHGPVKTNQTTNFPRRGASAGGQRPNYPSAECG